MPEFASAVFPGAAPPGADYFSVFNLPRKLALDTRALEQAFYRQSRAVHPDRFAQASAERQQWSLEQTSLLNDAYRTLRDPIARTEYLLRIEGVTAGGRGETPAQVPPELLAEVFELNMQLDELRAGDGDPQLRTDLEAARVEFEQRLALVDGELARAQDEWDQAVEAGTGAARGASAARMAALLDKRRYMRNLVREVREALGATLGEA